MKLSQSWWLLVKVTRTSKEDQSRARPLVGRGMGGGGVV